jgi:23S rRNA pseudouridine1911/1915/1917 synthase
LIGDATYGRARRAPIPRSPEEKCAFEAAMRFPRQALHAGVLGFFHPTKQAKMRFESPWPTDFVNLMNALRGLNSR